MLIVQFFDLLMLNIKYIPNTTRKTMATMARNFSSLTPRIGDVCDSMLFPCSGPFQWHNFYTIYLFFAKAHAIIILKLLQKLQPPISLN